MLVDCALVVIVDPISGFVLVVAFFHIFRQSRNYCGLQITCRLPAVQRHFEPHCIFRLLHKHNQEGKDHGNNKAKKDKDNHDTKSRDVKEQQDPFLGCQVCIYQSSVLPFSSLFIHPFIGLGRSPVLVPLNYDDYLRLCVPLEGCRHVG